MNPVRVYVALAKSSRFTDPALDLCSAENQATRRSPHLLFADQLQHSPQTSSWEALESTYNTYPIAV